jgi:Tfp pilus assembly protein PilF
MYLTKTLFALLILPGIVFITPQSAAALEQDIILESPSGGPASGEIETPQSLPAPPVSTAVLGDAVSELREAIRLDPNYASAHLTLGILLYTSGDIAGGLAELREAVRLKPNNAEARYHLALALTKQREGLATAEQNRAAVSGEPVLAETYLDLGKGFIAAGNMPAAVVELREALRLQPYFVEARASLGFALFNMGDVDGAIEEYRAVLRLQPDLAEAHLGLATALMAKHEWADAQAELQDALRLQPELTQAHYSLGVVRYTLGDISGAIDSYRQALRLKPNYAEAHYNLGLLMKLTNQEAEAAQEFLTAAEAGLPKAQYFLGRAYMSGIGIEKNLAAAVKWWSKAADQGLSQAREAIAQLRRVALVEGKQTEDSRVILEAFKQHRTDMWMEFPDLGNVSDETAGMSLIRQGRVSQAVPVLIREALALSEPAQTALQALYERGMERQLAPYDPRILAYFKTAAAEGLPRSRLIMAKIYAGGLGVPQDFSKAANLLKGNPDEEAQRLLREMSAAPQQKQQATTRTAAPRPPVTP